MQLMVLKFARNLSFFVALATTSFAQLPTAKEWSSILEKGLQQTSNWRVEWQIDQTISTTSGSSATEIAVLEEQLKTVSPDSRQAKGFRAAIVSMKAAEQKPSRIRVSIKAELLSSSKYHIVQQLFPEEGQSTLAEYFSDGDGLSYTVMPEKRTVKIGDNPVRVISTLLKGVPAFHRLTFAQDLAGLVFSPQGKNITLMAGNDPKNCLRIACSQDSLLINRMEAISDGVAIRDYKTSDTTLAGTPFPTEVSVLERVGQTEVIQQIWKLVKAEQITDPAVVETRYLLKPKYRVEDYTAGGNRTLKSEDLLPGK